MTEGEAVRIYLIDRNTLVRDGMRTLAESRDLIVCGGSSSAKDAEEDHKARDADVFVLALGQDAEQGQLDIKRLKTSYPRTPILLVSQTTDREVVRGCLMAGADGYLVKWATTLEFVRAVDSVVQGHSYLHPEIVPHILNDLRHRGGAVKDPLTVREVEVLRLISEGRTNTEIAASLFVSVSTVKNYVRALFSRFAVTDRTKLVVEAMKIGSLSGTRSEI